MMTDIYIARIRMYFNPRLYSSLKTIDLTNNDLDAAESISLPSLKQTCLGAT